jgi:hypothetical protein
MEFEKGVRRTFSVYYSNIQRIFFLRHPDPFYTYFILQLRVSNSKVEGGVELLSYSYVVMRVAGMKEMALWLNTLAHEGRLPPDLVRRVNENEANLWETYKALAEVLQWLCRLPLTVSFPLTPHLLPTV